MDFFDRLSKKAKETYKGASKKTGELAKEAKLRMKMNENKSEINDLYQEIGKKVYEKHTLSEEINIKVDLEEECTKIDVLSAEIERCLNQIRELKDKKQCPKCFNEIDLDAKFCNHCGARQEDVGVNEAEVVQPNSTNEQTQENANISENSNEEEQANNDDMQSDSDDAQSNIDTQNND